VLGDQERMVDDPNGLKREFVSRLVCRRQISVQKRRSYFVTKTKVVMMYLCYFHRYPQTDHLVLHEKQRRVDANRDHHTL
jgi:hypothetical protein